MPDTQNQNGYDESFWENVDSLRSFLEEEEKKEVSNNQTSQNTGSEPDDCQIHEEETEPAEKVSKKPQKRSHSRGKASSGLLVFLYLIIFLEIAAIGAVGVSWYLWIH